MSRPVATATDPTPRAGGVGTFMREAARSQKTVGAVAPTSAVAARRMARLIPAQFGGVIVELGAGTGPISAAIGERLGPCGRHFTVERDAEMLAAVAGVAPWAERVHGDAADLERLLEREGLYRVDAVISSLPWSNFPDALQRSILDQVLRVLTPDGLFATIVYRPTRLRASSRRFHAALRERFEETIDSSTIWGNLPPARLKICRRPTSGGPEWMA